MWGACQQVDVMFVTAVTPVTSADRWTLRPHASSTKGRHRGDSVGGTKGRYIEGEYGLECHGDLRENHLGATATATPTRWALRRDGCLRS